MHIKVPHLQVKLQLGPKANGFPGGPSKAGVPRKVTATCGSGPGVSQAEFRRLPEGEGLSDSPPGLQVLPLCSACGRLSGESVLLQGTTASTRVFFWEATHGYK